jgi:hypothetical protein
MIAPRRDTLQQGFFMPHALSRLAGSAAAIFLTLFLLSDPVAAQARTFTLAQLEAACRIHSSAYNCNRAAQQAQMRYGGRPTMYQWNSAVGVVRNWVRQGK